MRIMMIVVALSMSFGLAGQALAAGEPVSIVKQSQKLTGEMGKAFGPVKPILKGENPMVMDAVASAMTWHRNAKKLVANFPAGTGRDMVPETRAKPEVWSKRAEFQAAADKLTAESKNLIAAAKTNNINAFRVQFKKFGQGAPDSQLTGLVVAA